MALFKTCSKCRADKPINEFNKNRAKPDGRMHYCRLCEKTKRAIYRANNLKEVKHAVNQWHHNHRIQSRLNIKLHYARNMHAYTRKLEYNGNWKKNNPLSILVYQHNRRTRLHDNGGILTPNDINAIRSNQNDLCYYCHDPLRLNGTIDHKVPVSRGGSSNPSNIVLACKKCNSTKYTKTDTEFHVYMSALKEASSSPSSIL